MVFRILADEGLGWSFKKGRKGAGERDRRWLSCSRKGKEK